MTTTSDTEEKKHKQAPPNDPDFDSFVETIDHRFKNKIKNGERNIFTTDAEGLFAAYLAAIPEDRRQHYNCHCCRRFFEQYGGLVVMDDEGNTESVFLNDSSPMFVAVQDIVKKAKITGVFFSSEKVWGQPKTGAWTHLAITPPQHLCHSKLTLTAGQLMAEKREDFKTVCHALTEFTVPMVEQAVKLLRTDALYRSEKVLGVAEWLLKLLKIPKSSVQRNLLWNEVASAPAGFCHPRSSMIGTLLEDIKAGLDFSDVSKKFAAKMNPTQYQRPQAPPTAGNIAQAEKIIEGLKAAGALKRRFARLEELQLVWKPREKVAKEAETKEGVFAHLKPKGSTPDVKDIVAPPTVITWEKFQRTVLPTAVEISYKPHLRPTSFVALLTAVNPEAPPILQWDNEDLRNPVSLYVYTGGSTADQWGLKQKKTKVNGITLRPSLWNNPDKTMDHHGKGVIFILDGAQDTRGESAGAALFPEFLKSEFHGIRSTIEAYSRAAVLEGKDEASACGLVLATSGGHSQSAEVFEVEAEDGMVASYKIDRWD